MILVRPIRLPADGGGPARGAEFLTPPVEHDWEVRCFLHDPDGHLPELSEPKAPAAGS